MIVVSDTTSITSLLQIGQCELLFRLYGEVLIPQAVHRELLPAHPVLPDFLHVEAARNRAEVQRLQSELDLGEAEAIVLAKQMTADLLLILQQMCCGWDAHGPIRLQLRRAVFPAAIASASFSLICG